MKPRLLSLLFSAVLALSASLPAYAKDKATEDDDKDGKKNITTLVLAATPLAVHDAALQALAGIGCEVKKDTADQIEGKRPNKVGLAVGSGGEKLVVAIKDLGDGKTELKVTTKKTLLGIAGQKRWNEEVAAQIRDSLK